MASHRMTPKRRAALKKAQAASARKRRGKGKGKLASAHRKSRRNGRIAGAVGVVAVGAVAGAMAYTSYRTKGKSGSSSKFGRDYSKYPSIKKHGPGSRDYARKGAPGSTSKRGKSARQDFHFNRSTKKMKVKTITANSSNRSQIRRTLGMRPRGKGAPLSRGTKATFLQTRFIGNSTARVRQAHKQVYYL